MTLYGICRELDKCVCGLCAQITYGSNMRMAKVGRPPKIDKEKVLAAARPSGCSNCGALRRRKTHVCANYKPAKIIKAHQPGCANCGAKRLRKNHICPQNKPKKRSRSEAMRAAWVRRKAANETYQELDCGCYIFHGRRIKWCYKAHDPQNTPNPPQ